MTVGYIDEEAFSRKGVDRFIELARLDPLRHYVLGGRIEGSVRARILTEKPPNLELTGFLSHDDLRRLLWSSSVYVQLSWHETFGVAMAEAMLCGCVPLISDSEALGEVAGKWAVVSRSPDHDADAMDQALRRAEGTSQAEMAADVGARLSLGTRKSQLARAMNGGKVTARPTGVVRGGWSRTVLPVLPEMRVLDIGSGAFPNDRADILCDGELVDNRHRAGLPVVIDRPMVVADAGALPFRDGAFDYAIASHIAEHLPAPDSFCRELSRVASSGYIETPSPLADVLLHEDYHLWRVGGSRNRLRFARKSQPGRLARLLTTPVYFVMNAGQPSCEGRVMPLPGGLLGRAVKFGLRAVNGGLARLGVLHTRVQFSPTAPLEWQMKDR